MIQSHGMKPVIIMTFMVMMALMGCTQQNPEIAILNGSRRDITDFKLIDQTSATQAGITKSVFQFADLQNARLQITLAFKKEVPPIFEGGTFQMNTGTKIINGAVTRKNFRYFGGQGDGISIGGDFLFSMEDHEYQFHLPLTKLETFSY